MSPDFWALLAEPFPRFSCTWRVVEVADDLQNARLARTLTRAAIATRLDSSVGPSNWSFQLLPLGERSMVCNLSVCGVGRSGIVAVARGLLDFDARLLAEHALAAAAEQFGMRTGGASSAWVDFDAETSEPLYLPEEDEGDDGSSVRAGPVPTPTQATDQPSPVAGTEPKPTGHDVIERLLDRLREEGLGKQAARLVVTHGGYGRTQAESRELYGKLRALLVGVTAVTPT